MAHSCRSWLCVIAGISAVHTRCLQGVSWACSQKGLSQGKVLPGMPKSAKQAAARVSQEEYLGWRSKNRVLPHVLQPQPPGALVGCTSGRVGSGVVDESCLHPWLLMLMLVLTATPWGGRTDRLLILPLQMPRGCVKGHSEASQAMKR